MTTSASYSFPGKTFVLGEYAVLEGAPSLLLTTEPMFQLTCKERNPSVSEGMLHNSFAHELSPAGQWIKKHPHIFSEVELFFEDPYGSIGGLGASGAQFLAAYSYYAERKNELGSEEFLLSVWKAFKEVHKKEKRSPSGADVVAQASGGMVLFQQSPFVVESFPWFSESQDFVILHTGTKLATHEHLDQVELNDISVLTSICEKTLKLFQAKNRTKSLPATLYNELCSYVNEYQVKLVELGLQSSKTTELISEICSQYDIDAAKGCGALGVDTLLLFYNTEKDLDLEGLCQKFQLKKMAQKTELSQSFVRS